MDLVQEKTLTAKPSVPREVLRDYPGKWVALRSGQVIGVAEKLSDLMSQQKVRRDDVTYRVPSSRLTR